MIEVDIAAKRQSSLLACQTVHWVIAFLLMALAAALAAAVGMDIIEATLFVATGALAGFFTNDIAVTLLFWPTERRLKGLLLGIFFRRREEFGEALVEQARQRFLNPEFFTNLVRAQAVQDTLYESVRGAVTELAHAEIGKLGDFLSRFLPESDRREEFLNRIAEFVGNEIAHMAFRYGTADAICTAMSGALKYVGSFSFSTFAPDADRVRSEIDGLIIGFLRGSSRKAVLKRLFEWADKAMDTDRPLGSLIPEETRERVEQIGRDYASSVATRELSRLCADPKVRARIVAAVHQEVRGFVYSRIQGIEGFKGLFIRLSGAKDIEEALDQVPAAVEDFIASLPEILSAPQTQEYLREAMTRAIRSLWAVRINDIRQWLSDDFVEQVMEGAFDAASSETVRSQIAGWITDWLASNSEKPLSDIFPTLFEPSPDKESAIRSFSSAMAAHLRDSDTREEIKLQVRIVMRRVMVKLLDTHLERLVDVPFIRRRGLDMLTESAAGIMLKKLQQLGPVLVEKFPVREHLSDVWESMTNKQIQDAVHGVLANEFQILINLGISFGAFVGFVSLLFQSLSGPTVAAILWILLVIAYGIFKSRVVRDV